MIDEFLDFLVQEQGYENLDEYLDRTPYISKPEKHMQLNLRCDQCGDTYSESFGRQHADRLASHHHCPHCQCPYQLVSVIPHTVFFWSHSVKHASFSDDTSGECWHCGATGDLHRFRYSNGQEIALCQKDFKRYVRISYKLQVAQERAD